MSGAVERRTQDPKWKADKYSAAEVNLISDGCVDKSPQDPKGKADKYPAAAVVNLISE